MKFSTTWRRNVLKRAMIVTAIVGMVLLTLLPGRVGRRLQGQTEKYAFDYIKAIAEKSLPEAAFLEADRFRSEWDRFVAEYLTNAEILKVNAFSKNGQLVYSTGRISSKEEWHVSTIGRIMLTEVGLAKRITSVYGNEEAVHAMRMYIPLYSGRHIFGTLELVQDIEFIYGKVRGMQAAIGVITLALLLGLSLVMYGTNRQEAAEMEKKNQKLGTYDSDVSRRLRDPLTSIKGFAATLLEDISMNEDERRGLLKTIVAESDLLAREINDILNLSSLENSRIYLSKKPVRIDALLKESVDQAAKQAKTGKVKLETKMPKEIYEVNVDREKMVKAMGNLLIASVMRSMAGGKVSLGAKYVKDGVRFEVSDNGEELSPEEISSYFDRFHWVERAGAQRHETGLELPLAKAIVEAHSGKINVESKANEGAKFNFKLPVIKS